MSHIIASAGVAAGLTLCAAAGVASASPPLSVYGNLPGFEMAALSPAGERVAVIGTVDEKRRLIVLDKDKKALASVAIDDATKVRDLLWAGEGTVLVETSVTAALGLGFTTPKAELYAMTVIPLQGGKTGSVFEGDRLIRGGIQGFYGVNRRGDKWFGYFGGVTLDAATGDPHLGSLSPVLYEVDLQTHIPRAIARRTDGDDVSRTWLVDASGAARLTLDYASRDGSWRITNTDHVRVATGQQKFGNVGLVGFGATPDTFIYREADGETGADHWYEVPLAGGAPKEILADQSIGTSFFDRQTRRLIGYRQSGDIPSYRFFDAYQAKVVAATQKAFPGRAVHLIDWNDAFNRLIVWTEGPGDPQTWWLVDIKTGSADILGTAYPIPGKDVGPMRMIAYKAGDGLTVSAVLTLPPAREPKDLPVVVLPHGGPTARDYPGFDWWAQAFAARGYAVLQPNFRGSSGYGTAFVRAGYGEWGRKMQTDISEGLAELVRQGIADPKRACIVGASYGGYAALAGVTLQHGLYRCAVAFAGISDVAKLVATERYASNGDPTLMRSLKQEIGSGRDLAAVSPIRFASTADAPILLIHGKDDTVVEYAQSSDMADALRRAKKPFQFVTLPQSDHWLSTSQTRFAMLEATMAFVEKYNPSGGPSR